MKFQLEAFFLLLTVSSYREWSALDFTLLGSPESKATIVSQPVNKEFGTRFNINFESCNFSESKKIKCGSSDSSRGFSLLIKVHECLDTITSHHRTCQPSKSELSEAEPIVSRDSNHWPYEKSSGTDGDLLPRGDSHTKVTRVLVVCRFWSHLGCLGRKVTKYAHSGIA